jgi:hypothetical protein
MVTGSVDDKLQELQEAIQKLQMLKQLGAENLVIEQEKAIFSLQKDIMELNTQTSMDPVDYLLGNVVIVMNHNVKMMRNVLNVPKSDPVPVKSGNLPQ